MANSANNITNKTSLLSKIKTIIMNLRKFRLDLNKVKIEHMLKTACSSNFNLGELNYAENIHNSQWDVIYGKIRCN